MKCLLFASWKPYTTHPLAGYIHQITGRHRVVVRAHLDFTSRSSIEQSVIWKCRAATSKLKAASLVSMTHCLSNVCLETTGLEETICAACCIPAFCRDERDILDHVKLVCTFSQILQMLSLKAPCKCMHECLTQVLTRTVARFTKSRLISLRGSFKHIYKLCDTNSSDLSVWSSFAPFCICTAVPNGLPVLAFANSKHSHCKRIPNDSKPLLAWFERMPSAPIFLDHPSTKTGVSLEGKNCTAGIDTTEPWLCPSNLALRSIGCTWFRDKAHLPHQKRVQDWRELVPGRASLPVVERWLWGARKTSDAAVVAGNVARQIAFEAIDVSAVPSWRNLRAFACLGPQRSMFFWSYGFDYFFGVITAMHFVQANVAMHVFFSTWSVCLFCDKMLKNIEKLWLCYAFGFGTKAIYGHICLYVATYMYTYLFFWSSSRCSFD